MKLTPYIGAEGKNGLEFVLICGRTADNGWIYCNSWSELTKMADAMYKAGVEAWGPIP
jgi:hypothetical protein